MALSMTGCGVGVAADGDGGCRVEIRGVNGRQLKVSIRSREAIAALDSRIEAVVRSRVQRGTLHLTVEPTGAAIRAGRRLDRDQLATYLDDVESFCAARGLPLPATLDGILGLPGVVLDAPADGGAVELVWPTVERAVATALDAFDAMRRQEGQALTADMRSTCGEILAIVEAIRSRVPGVVSAYRGRLLERVGKLLADSSATLTPADVAREVALVADRTDVAEELVRLASHVDQFSRLLDEESPGRSLDFLAQEIGREANTIASKSLDVSIAHAVVDIKTRVERLREQAQNIE
jgi:uncharacterized protein (TIGR00255 family)